MIVRISYQMPGNEICRVKSCVEMSVERLAAYYARIEAGESRIAVLEEAERNNPRAHRKHWHFAQADL